MKLSIHLIFIFSFLFVVQSANGQIFKKIKNKIDDTGQKIGQKLNKNKSTKSSETTTPTVFKSKPVAPVINFEEGFVIQAYNDRFLNFELQQFRGKPRFGRLNHYGTNVKDNLELREKMKEWRYDYARYNKLLQTKYLSSLFDVMDRKIPYDVKKSTAMYGVDGSAQERASAIAQSHLCESAYILFASEEFKKYFCRDDRKCNPGRNRRIPQVSVRWGGKDEFEIVEKYQKFVTENYEVLRSWPDNIVDEGYLVEVIELGDYDFENGGFQLQISPMNYDKLEPLDAKGLYDGKSYKRRNFSELYKMDGTKAKDLINRLDAEKLGRRIFAVYKIKYYGVSDPVGLFGMPYNKKITLASYVTSPVVELFEDEALTIKIGEVTLE